MRFESTDGGGARRRFSAGVLGFVAAALVGLAPSVQAQGTGNWPEKPIKLIINFPPGSSPDIVGRAVAAPLQEVLGQPVVPENRAGAGGSIGADLVAKAAPDGYTVLMSAGSTMTIYPSLHAKMAFDPVRDLTPVAGASRMVLFLVTRPELPAKTLSEFLAYAKTKPGAMSYGSAGNGTGPHLAAEMMNSRAGVQTVHVPYKGAAPALQDLLGGQVQFYFDPGIALDHVRAGKLRMLGVAGLKRSALFPDVPTFDEVGMKGFDAGTTHGFYVPAGTPPAIVARLNREINRILASKPVHDTIAALGAEATPISPAEFRKVLDDDTKRYREIIRERNIKEN